LREPLGQIEGTLGERRRHRDEAVRSIAASWGGEQTVVGPVLVVPYSWAQRVTQPVTQPDGRAVPQTETVTRTAQAWFLPEKLEVEGELEPSVRQRGIFAAVVYSGALRLHGTFAPDPAKLELGRVEFHWDRARVLVSLSDPRGLRAAPVLEWGGKHHALSGGTGAEGWGGALATERLNVAPGASMPFRIDLAVQGHRQLNVVPTGGETRIALAAPWPDPSFVGYYLPVERSVDGAGFAAEWRMAHFGRGFPPQWVDGPGGSAPSFETLTRAACGVQLLQPVDAYRLVERAIKYALLILVLVFAVFFLFEVTAGVRVHPIQYLLVGAGLVLFYLGFLALGEFVGAGWAYGIAAAACTVLISSYAASVLRTGRRTLAVGGGLAATYGYLYFVLQLQDYALLAGTAALFAMLALAMASTRKIDWYRAGRQARDSLTPSKA
jgi:inner membrane protein